MGRIVAIFWNTVLETVRQPLYALVLILTCGMITVTPAMAAHIYTFGAGTGLEHAGVRMVADLGLATMLLSGLVLAVFSASGVISREIDERTALTVLSKQVSRTTFVVGKYFGVALSICLAALTCTAILMLTVRMGARVAVGDPMDWGALIGILLAALISVGIATFRNFYRGRAWVGSFSLSFVCCSMVVFLIFTCFDKDYNFAFSPSRSFSESLAAIHAAYDWEVARAALLTVEAILMMAGVAVAVGTRLGVSGNFGVCAVVFVAGLTGEYFCAKLGAENWLAQTWATVIPDLQVFWMSDALTRERPIPTEYMVHASAYASCYVLAMLFFAAFLFQKREVS